MKILVPVKRVVDHNVRIRVKPDGTGVSLDGVKMAMNPFDEIAVEQAVQLMEAGIATEIVVVSIGSLKAEETLRSALALGADRAVIIEAEDGVEPLGVAKILARVVAEEDPQLVIMGKQAIDDDSNQTGQMLAGLLGWGQATFASKVAVADAAVEVTREVDGGLLSVRVPLPAVITTDLRLNQPRYPSLPNIMKAKKKPMERRRAADYGVDIAPRLTVLNTEEPVRRSQGIRVENAIELVAKLKSEAGVL